MVNTVLGMILDEVDVKNLTIPEYILGCVKEYGDNEKDFIIDVVTGKKHTFAEIPSLTARIASYLYKSGMRKGDTLIYMPLDMVHLHVIFLGVWRANGIVRASYPEDDEGKPGEETLLDRIEESRAGWILCEPSTAKSCLAVASKIYWDVEIIVIGDDTEEGCTPLQNLFEDDGTRVPRFNLRESDIAMILCTSGTTGKSKGAVHTHKTLLRLMLAVPTFMPFSEDRPTLLASKGTHISGSVFPLGALAIGRTCLCMGLIAKENIFKAVDHYKPAVIFGFPTFLLQLVNDPEASKFDFSSVEYAATGGAPVTPAIESTLMKLPNMKAVLIIYGLTEVCPVSSAFDPRAKGTKKHTDMPSFSIGRACPGVQLQIRDSDTREVLGPNQQGEICIKSPCVFHNYYKNPEASEKAFVDGWFLTGDIGYYDEQHFIFLVDRLKEIFKYYNNHISPTEIEDVIASHPSVAEVCVVGVPDPDGGDRIPRAFVTLRGKTRRKTPESVAIEILEFANEKLANYKHLRGGVYILPELPKGKTGKISRQIMMELQVPAHMEEQ